VDFTDDKMCSMVKKWQTTIKVHVGVKTTDGYLLRLFCVSFIKKTQQSDTQDLLCSAPAGLPNSEDDDGYHDPRGTDK
jgi:hypothetical protein